MKWPAWLHRTVEMLHPFCSSRSHQLRCTTQQAPHLRRPASGTSCRVFRPVIFVVLQGVKSVAIARQYLASDSTDVCFSATFRDDNHSRNLLALQVHTGDLAALQSTGELVDIRVGSKSRHAKVGGAIAARLREGKQVCPGLPACLGAT